ncbi:hypothetical protein GMLC_01080 [Geomonas limicola]|uniref:Phosphatidylethanolamine-binding protein n=1 Tax=Geomonas limicola TaxID=2740186 RepID=A0A6V8N5F5_9BACT|nr:YbhB/YbcL family Raf kinase inhibitor-like protein [Geomonas limicola]GFO66529.1 hypothetical protein GMLC_01080 [Geomonas limicola]
MQDQQEMRLTSPAFQEGQAIPEKYTCDGENVNPPLTIAYVPPGTKSLALVIDDPDAPHGTFTHWMVWNLSPRQERIEENAELRETVCGKNSWGHNSYGGPCPPSGTHHYHFMLYALDSTLDISGNSNREMLANAMEDHIIAVTQLVGLYSKKG